ncbi:MAG: hypothetical protein ACTSRG_22675 [Candidatus Helarchaeota archaeon]
MTFKKNDSFTATRWKRARALQKVDFKRTGTEKPLKEFYKNDNPISQKMNKYEVTFALDYTGEDYNFNIPQESFIIYTYGDFSPEEEINEMTRQGVSQIFRGKAQSWVYEKTDITIRGVEDTGKVKYGEFDETQLINNNVFTDKIPPVSVNKTRKGGGTNKNSYGLNLWI